MLTMIAVDDDTYENISERLEADAFPFDDELRTQRALKRRRRCLLRLGDRLVLGRL